MPGREVDAEVRRAAEVLRAGGLVAFPTETVYGLGADARNEGALRRIFELKGRPADHPLIVHLPSAGMLGEWAREVPEAAHRLAERFWPGPLTLILRRCEDVLDAVTGGQETVGLRVPGHPLALELLRAFGGGVAAPSANRFGRVSPTTAEHVRQEFSGRVDVILDGGPCEVGLESTILDLSARVPRLLRPGAVTLAQLSEVLGEVQLGGEAAPRVPGSLESHYAPATKAVLARSLSDYLQEHAQKHLAVLARSQKPAWLESRVWLTLPGEPDAYARRLYAALRELDAAGCDEIVIEVPPDTPEWLAVRDRLARAAVSGGGDDGSF